MVDTKEFVELQQGQGNSKRECKIATVVEIFENGTAKIMYRGEDVASEKEYSYLASYIPAVADTVLLLPFLETYIIIGKVLYKETENKEEYITVDSLNELLNGFATTDTLSQYATNQEVTDTLTNYAKTEDLSDYYKPGNSLIAGNFSHRGSYIGFFNGAIQSKQYVSTISTTSDLATTIGRLNKLINALGTYGLV